MSGPSTSRPIKERANRALVHDEFEQIEVINEKGDRIKKSQCKHCDPDSRYRVLGKNPSSLRDHLKAHHPDIYLRSKGIFHFKF